MNGTELLAFVVNKDNFDFIYELNGCGEYREEDDVYQAFTEMMSKERHISTAFRFGLLDDTIFGHFLEPLK